MKEITLRRWHGRVGAVIAFFVALQAASGIALGWGLARSSPLLGAIAGAELAPSLSDGVLRLVHSGSRQLGFFYNVLLGLGLIWMAVSGVVIYLRGRKRRGNSD